MRLVFLPPRRPVRSPSCWQVQLDSGSVGQRQRRGAPHGGLRRDAGQADLLGARLRRRLRGEQKQLTFTHHLLPGLFLQRRSFAELLAERGK